MIQLQFSLLICLLLPIINGQDTFGRHFRFMFMDNYVDCPVYRPVDLYICNKDSNSVATVNVTIPYLNHESCPSSQSVSINSSQCSSITLCQEIRHTYADGSLARKAVEVVSDQDVSVTGFNVEKFSADSYVILPWSVTGQIHCVLSYTPQHIQTQFSIVTMDRTKIRIVIPDRPGETLTVDYNGLRYSNGETLQFTLDPTETFLAQSAGDLTGVLIQSDKPVAVFTGNVRTFVDFNKRSRDHLVEQVPSATRWGKEFIYVPTPRNRPGDTVRVLARSANTMIELITDTVEVVTLSAGGLFVELQLDEVTHIRSDQMVLVAVIVRSQDSGKVGNVDPADPSLYFLPAISQYSNEYYLPAFMDADNEPYQKVFVLVVVPETSVAGLLVNNNIINSSVEFTKPSSNRSLPYRAAAIQLASTTAHKIGHINGESFMAIGYGASDRESFASALGYNFTVSCHETVSMLSDGIDNDCDGLIDEEICGNSVDDDGDGLNDEDCSVQAGSDGDSFAVTFMSNVVRDTVVNIDQIELYISALEPDTQVNVTAPAYEGPNKPMVYNLEALINNILQIQLNPVMRVFEGNNLGRSRITNKGIKVESNKNIVLYGINKKQFSTDGFLAIPSASIGSSYYAFCNFPINIVDDRCQFAVVAIEDSTEVVIDLADDVKIEPLKGKSYTGPVSFTVMVNAYQVLEIQSRDDLTGTRVYTKDGKRFSFFSGNVRTRVPVIKGSRDHLVEQIPPTDTWGTEFSIISTPRDEDLGDLFKVIASEGNTVVSYTYIQADSTVATGTLSLGSAGSSAHIDLGFGSPMSVVTDKPVLVIQISKSATDKDTDPAAIVVPPHSQWSHNYKFVTPLSGQVDNIGQQLPFENYVMVAINSSLRSGLSFTNPLGEVVQLGDVDGWIPIPGTTNEALLYSVSTGQSAITHSDPNVQFMGLMYGRADRETYGNAIGFKLNRNACSLATMSNGDNMDNDCDGMIDEEPCNGVDDDLDDLIDEDCGNPPVGNKYILVLQENVVEYPRNYALEIYVGNSNEGKAFCRLETPNTATPSYDLTVGVESNQVQEFAVSAALRARGSRRMRGAITVTCDLPVTVMAVNKETFSNDAFLAFEKRTLDKEYYTVSYGPPTIQSQFAVVAVEGPGTTTVTMEFTAPVVIRNITYNSITVELYQYDIFQAQSDRDLTGSHITSNRRVAAFSGNIRAKVALSKSRDHLASQLPPTSSWGTEFMLVPTSFRTVGELFRVIAKESDTSFIFRGDTINLPTAGSFYEIDLDSSLNGRLISTKPIMVMQIMKSQAKPNSSEAADPCFILVPPTSQYIRRTSLITPMYTEGFYQTGSDYKNYLTVILPGGSVSGLRLNGQIVTVSSVRNIRDSVYQAVDIMLNEGGLQSYIITHINHNVKFSGYLVGIADRESYCVHVGSNLPEVV